MNTSGVALVVGGSRGIGEAVALDLLEHGCSKVVVADRVEPLLIDARVEWISFDLAIDRAETLKETLERSEIVILTAGIGRLDSFDTFDVSELERTMKVNALSSMSILQLCSGKLASEVPFHAMVVTSVAGLLSSPFYAIYAASKAALSRYVESVNAELAGREFANRITEVVPGRIEGTGFHGGPASGPEALRGMATSMLDAMLGRKERLLFDEGTYGPVLERYHADPLGFGVDSYRYKLASAPMEPVRKAIIGYLSGTFDLFHVGHLNLLRRARANCDRLVVGVHGSGAWKGKETYIPLVERKAILASCRYVDEVVDAPEEDDVAWDSIHYDRLFVGSDYEGTPRFERYERVLCPRGVKIVYFPYTTGTSSTKIRAAIAEDGARFAAYQED